jgi:hypothetical protein
MAVARNLEEYRAIQKKRIAILQKGKRRGPITAAKYMAAQMRSIAPRTTGNLISTIHQRKNRVEVRGSNPRNGFPYVHWVNATPGFERVNYPSGSFTFFQKARSGNQIGYKFYSKSVIKTQKFFREAMLDVLAKTLRAEF